MNFDVRTITRKCSERDSEGIFTGQRLGTGVMVQYFLYQNRTGVLGAMQQRRHLLDIFYLLFTIQ